MNKSGANNMKVTLPIAYSNADYFVVATAFTDNQTKASDGAVSQRTSTGFWLVNLNYTYPMFWKTCGFSSHRQSRNSRIGTSGFAEDKSSFQYLLGGCF